MVKTEQVLSQKGPATELGTRDLLAAIMAVLGPTLTADKAGMIEIALAEIINNIVEHAYADRTDGEIQVDISRQGSMLQFEISDNGTPLPGGELPPGDPPDVSGPRDMVPEGGFGWMLVRSLAQALHYTHAEGRNVLMVSFDLGDAGG